MRRFLRRLRDQQRRKGAQTPMRKVPNAAEPHVIVPEDVSLPHPTNTENEVKVPASINGNDMTKGRP